MEHYIPLIISALGGAVLGPLLSRLLGGNGALGVIGGILGGVGAHYGADAAAVGNWLGTSATMVHVQNFLEGGIGGGALGLLVGVFLKRR